MNKHFPQKIHGIKSFNQYVKAEMPKHDWIDIGFYPDSFILASPPVYPDFYRISIKLELEGEDGRSLMFFSSPNQPVEWDVEKPFKGYYIQITEDIIANYQHLEYSFLTYGLHEPLYLEKEEEMIITQIFKDALREYESADFSMNLLLAYCNLMFAHVSKFYERQFGERKEKYNRLVNDFFELLNTYYNNNQNVTQPTVAYFAKKLNITPNYLSDLIKFHTGKPVLEHIHLQIIDTSKNLLKSNKHTVSEIAYKLGFEYPNYFSRLFKKVTGKSPSNFQNQ
ncbi:helix-turn-helix domain-containing protein [Chryseobacterium oranimense]|uniref:helix-turn-helix domain-containing protein n=1 Tax=Chryseobacterium oranimense TaxID=421058 RepID=UPI0021AEE71E|nr:helix-turn-helix domain-containing protein [Chryseobacterium oranimense]UWX61813.1 helix-turn-helix domain-containing protein [Chryseobacterium oranimense]